MSLAKVSVKLGVMVLNQGSGGDLGILILQRQYPCLHHFIMLRGHVLIIELVRESVV